jgi:oligosaccharide repeat unit polymerase
MLITIFEISTGNYLHKADIYNSGSIIVSIGFRAVLIFIILYALELTKYGLKHKKIDIKLTIFVFTFVFLLVFFSGERDLLIRFFVILSFVYYIIVKNSKISKEVVFLFIISLLSIPILARYKYFGLTGESTESNMNFFLSFLNSDFQSASKNLQILLLDESSNGVFEGLTFLSAFLRALELDKILNIDVISSNEWFNDRYFEVGRAGQGFSLVGDGYINFGYMGIIILFIFIALIVRLIYLNSNKGVYYFVFYIISIPVFMYSIRADLANVLSQLIQQNIFSLVLIYLIMSILYKTSRKKKRKKE